jgi:outer membrane lipoprotein-sorting protein
MIIIALGFSSLVARPQSGENVVKLMYKRYAGKWSQTLTFDQTTEIYRDSTRKVQEWHEYILYPDKLRIDIEPMDSGKAAIYRNDSTYSIQKGEIRSALPNENDFIFLLGGMYFYPLEKTIERLKNSGYDLSRFGEDTLDGKPIYIIGAADRHEHTSQLWIDQRNLYLVRMIKYSAKNKLDATFENYIKIGDGATETKVTFYLNDKLRQVETYHHCQTAPDLDNSIFDPFHYKKIIP